MKFSISILIFLISLSTNAATLYQCEDDRGRVSFQDKPCLGETIKVTNSDEKFDNSQYGQEVVRALAKVSGKSEEELKDPKIRQAAEIFAATDAAKSYAFTKIYEISANYCPAVREGLETYKEKAAAIITLGEYFYTNGIQANIDGKDLSKTGEELTKGLNEMLVQLDEQHKSASKIDLEKKCKKASEALKMLTTLYSR